MRIVVTGATGFVGGPLVRFLVARGWSVRAAGRRPLTNVESVTHGDLARTVDWGRVVDGCDAVVHLAGIAHTGGTSDDLYEQVNHRQTVELARAARRAGVRRMVFVSSIRAMVGTAAPYVLDETYPESPTDAYGRSKLAGERGVAESGVSFANLRPVLIYGPGVKGNLALLRKLAALPVPLPFGAMRNRRSLCALPAVLEAIDLVARPDVAAERTFVLADREPMELRELLVALRRAAGKSPRLVPVPPRILKLALRLVGRREMWDRLGGDLVVNPRALTLLGWQPRETGSELAP